MVVQHRRLKMLIGRHTHIHAHTHTHDWLLCMVLCTVLEVLLATSVVDMLWFAISTAEF